MLVSTDTALDADDQGLFRPAVVIAIAGQPAQVVAHHALAQARPRADLAFAGERHAVVGGAASQPQEH
jgi:hypothetical protein